MKFLNLLKYQIYLLQLENYDLGRYFFTARNNFKKSPETRKPIVWTFKLQLVVVLGAILGITADLLLTWAIGGPTIVSVLVFLVLAAGLSFVFFAFLILSIIILTPVDLFLKRRLVAQARLKRAEFPNLKVIAIAGSYGKTTIKEMVASVLSQKYKVLKTPENINTPLGISRMILDKLTPDTEFLIVEVGEYVPGDVAAICELVKPSAGIITGINQAHLERMGNIKNTTASIFELAGHMPPGVLVLNADDEMVRQNFQTYQAGHQIKFYSSADNSLSEYQAKNIEYGESGLKFEITKSGESLGRFQTLLLADYALGVSVAGIILGKHYDLTIDEIRHGIAALQPVPHRMQILPNSNDVTVIDDSYNGNPAGVAEAIKVLARFKGRRKVYITPGLVEMGAESPALHYNIGKALATVADQVVLIKNSVSADIQKGLMQNGFPAECLMFYDSAAQAHADLVNIIKPNDVVMFQNDWPENYL